MFDVNRRFSITRVNSVLWYSYVKSTLPILEAANCMAIFTFATTQVWKMALHIDLYGL